MTLNDVDSSTPEGKAAIQKFADGSSCRQEALDQANLAMRDSNSPNLAKIRRAVEKTGRRMRVTVQLSKETKSYYPMLNPQKVTKDFYPTVALIQTWDPSKPNEIESTELPLKSVYALAEKVEDFCDAQFKEFNDSIDEQVKRKVLHIPVSNTIRKLIQYSAPSENSTSEAIHEL